MKLKRAWFVAFIILITLSGILIFFRMRYYDENGIYHPCQNYETVYPLRSGFFAVKSITVIDNYGNCRFVEDPVILDKFDDFHFTYRRDTAYTTPDCFLEIRYNFFVREYAIYSCKDISWGSLEIYARVRQR